MTDKPRIPEEAEKTPLPRGRQNTPFNPPNLNAKPGSSGSEALDHIRERLDAVFDPDVGALSDIRRTLSRLLQSKQDEQRAILSMKDCLQSMVSKAGLNNVQPAKNPGLVLIVDDEPMVRAWIERVLVQAGHTTVSARDIPNAEQMLASHPIDVALIDLHLSSGRSGLDLARLIRDQYRHVGCVIITGLLSQEDAAAALALGVTVVEKPTDNDALLDAIDAAHAGRRSLSPQSSGD